MNKMPFDSWKRQVWEIISRLLDAPESEVRGIIDDDKFPYEELYSTGSLPGEAASDLLEKNNL